MKHIHKVQENFQKAISEYSMFSSCRGVLVGFSGGADSTALLHLLKSTCDLEGIYLAALHVHHGIRGAEADRDAEFCASVCEHLGVDFHTEYFDVPTLASEWGKGLEETARMCRYRAFAEKVKADSRLDRIATAHNADDNTETLIYNISRGCGIDGLLGIPPIRYEDGVKVIRPLIYCTKNEIVNYLDDIGMEFIYDSTNDDISYTRNYIRHKILPAIREINPSFSNTVSRMTYNLRYDASFLDREAERFLKGNLKGDKISSEAVAYADEAISSRAVARMINNATGSKPEAVHIEAVLKLAKTGKNSSSVYVCKGTRAVINDGVLSFTAEGKYEPVKFEYYVNEGVSRFSHPDFAVIMATNVELATDLQKDNEYLQNIYKLSICTRLNFDKINGTLFVRSRRDGDAYRFGGMTRKLKKLYNDRKLPHSVRELLPVFCDDSGIIWVPGFPPADRVKSDGAEYGTLAYYYNNGE